MMTRAQIRRHQAITSFVDAVLPALNGYNPTCTAERAAELVRPLAELGKTARWKRSIEIWAAMILEEPGEDANHLRWAVLQGSVYAGHAAV